MYPGEWTHTIYTVSGIILILTTLVSSSDIFVKLDKDPPKGGNQGRVLLTIHDREFTISLENWNNVAAKVICRTLNLTSSGAKALSLEAKPGALVWDKSLYCRGHEKHVKDCIQEEINVKAYKGGDAGVICENAKGAHSNTKEVNPQENTAIGSEIEDNIEFTDNIEILPVIGEPNDDNNSAHVTSCSMASLVTMLTTSLLVLLS